MAMLRFLVCLILVLLSFPGSETRLLHPQVEGRKNVTASFEAMFRTFEVVNHYQPQRNSPGGPDPQHH
ncbi:hypothetical protein CsSME_00031847 [Camellia sinensis var. sinensis]